MLVFFFIIFPISAEIITEVQVKISIVIGLSIYLVLQVICLRVEVYFEKAKDANQTEIIIWNINISGWVPLVTEEGIWSEESAE